MVQRNSISCAQDECRKNLGKVHMWGKDTDVCRLGNSPDLVGINIRMFAATDVRGLFWAWVGNASSKQYKAQRFAMCHKLQSQY